MSSVYVRIISNGYRDSVQLLYAESILAESDGITQAHVAMGTLTQKQVFADMGLMDSAIISAKDQDLVIAAIAESSSVFATAAQAAMASLAATDLGSAEKHTYPSLEQALRERPDAQVCMISIPGEYAKAEALRALNSGMHVILFSSHIFPEDELELKLLARSKGLLLMGPDCGVVNLNGTAYLLSSLTHRGPFGLCGATGVGIQHIGALLHAAGSGVSQIIGTGGGDLKQPIGGLSMLSGIDALEADPQTQYILLASRKPDEKTMNTVFDRVSQCRKPVVLYFMGCDREPVEKAGAIYASNLDEVAVKALELIGIHLPLQTEEELDALAQEAVRGMSPQQRYVRGLFTGGTYCDEAMRAMQAYIGGIYSNCPVSPRLLLEDSRKTHHNACVDYGEDEFTVGKPHPTMEPSIRKPYILREGNDPHIAVMLFDFIFAAPAHPDPVGVVLEEIRQAQAAAASRGGKLAVVAAVCGTDADFQNLSEQKDKLRSIGAYVCDTNYLAAKLAGKIIQQINKEA